MIKKILPLFIVVLAGETIFMHPFLVPRLYRSLMMDVWGISNTDVGIAFSAYGLTAMLSYIFGGPFADKYEPRGLMVISILVTALGSSLLFFNPSSTTLIIAYGFFGVSTIFLMWSAMIKVTHEIGGEESRASAMGILEGGRGLVAALMSSFLVFLVGMNTNSAGEILDKAKALNSVYLSISIFMVFVSIIVWFGLKNVETKEAKAHDWTLEKAKSVFGDFNLWLLAIIILSAYCSYKNVGNYSVYMRDVKGMSIIESSTFTSYIFWLRPLSALIAGIFADKLTLKVPGGRFITLVICFLLGAIGQIFLALDFLPGLSLIMSAILFSACFAYALRAIYFSVFGDFKISDGLVGTAVGVVSLIGYLPDFFFGTFTGYLIDEFPGQLGFSYVFGFNGTLLVVGAIASYLCYRRVT
jgi:MFS family permease